MHRATALPAPRLPSELENECANAGLELARRELKARHWRTAYENARNSWAANPPLAGALMA